MILGAALWLQRSLTARVRLRCKALRALSGAFIALEGSVRLTLTPLPDLLRQSSCETEASAFFAAVSENLSRGEALAPAWEQASSRLPLSARERETVAALGHLLSGEEESVCAALTLASRELSAAEEKLRQQAHETGRITAALCLGCGVMLCILLL